MKKMIEIILIVIGIIMFIYGVVVGLSFSGNNAFYLAWIFAGIMIAAAGVILKLFDIPKPVLWIVGGLVGAFVLFMIVMSIYLLGAFGYKGDKGADYCLILGAHVRSDGPSKALRYRLNAGYDYLMENPDTICIVSGGQGENEPESEASAMKKYLVDKGIDPDRIIMEDKSTSTKENMLFSKELMKEDSKVAIVTNNFHVRRAVSLAKANGYKDVSGVAAGTDAFFVPLYLSREAIALVKEVVFGNV